MIEAKRQWHYQVTPEEWRYSSGWWRQHGEKPQE
jgi:hypothetical protein